jgi:hypothetical protein
VPQDGIGGLTPIPTKLNPASIKIAEAKFAEIITIIGPIILGNIWLKMILLF